MKFKILAGFGLSAVLFIAGCGGGNNNANANTNATNNKAVATPTPTPVTQTNESAATDTTLKTKVEDALKKKGFTGITVDTTTTPATLRGTVPKNKMTEVIQTAQEAAGKPFKNELTEQK
ncbi:MAG: hypothetical protein M3384_11245 [Acidobacteriota bacterium]|nr:hypothetical protein [Acidobacteriota bacterium]